LVREQQKLNFLSGLGVMSEMGAGLMMSVLSAEGEVRGMTAGVEVEVRCLTAETEGGRDRWLQGCRVETSGIVGTSLRVFLGV
jgi:hypothetical protein